ncbi:hypothetical protein HPP92_011403 [Vanilla planifolia]|uniref:Amino acid transporter transmembrane domain-containing protein n=1 Tax=Vanilla planifolia TaxID=51239 RepID=A0A835QVM2_VANPL|nr:hypothetical protein HPP92_011403 [Vanilla planifolia]
MDTFVGLGLQQTHDGIKGLDDDGRISRTGTVWTSSAHIITAVIGSGVLSLAWAIGQLGWVAGPIVMILFAFVIYYTSALLADCYRTGDPMTGKRNYTYSDAVQAYLGGMKVKICGVVQYVNLFGVAIGYTIAASISMMAIRRSNCFHEKGHQRHHKIAAPSESKVMKRATLVSVAVTTVFYMLCGCMGYAAFGDAAPGNLLTGFGFYNPFWLLDIANAAIVIHLVGAYQPDMAGLKFFSKEIRIRLCSNKSYSLNLFRLVWRSAFVVLTTVISMLLPSSTTSWAS